MVNFILFAAYLCLGATLLVAWPIMIHPTLPPKRKMLLITLAFFLLVPLAILMYMWLGVPQMAVE